MNTRTLPLTITENDGHVTVRCTAGRELNGGEPCVWSWRLARGQSMDAPIEHAFERHMPEVPYE